jgi:chromosomal replication initiator protein
MTRVEATTRVPEVGRLLSLIPQSYRAESAGEFAEELVRNVHTVDAANANERQLELGEEEALSALRGAWDKILRTLSHKYNKATFENFLSPLQLLSFDGAIIVLGAPSSFARDWAEKKYAQVLVEQFKQQVGLAAVDIRFVVSTPEMKPVLGEKPLPLQIAASPAATALTQAESSRGKGAAHDGDSHGRGVASRNIFTRELANPELNPRYTFDEFAAGKSNQLAHAGAKAVAEKPGETYNPLFLYGGSGLGKTHLLHAIGHQVRVCLPQSRVAYVSGETFTNHYVAAVRDRKTEDFRRAYRNVDVWLVDDIQTIATREQTKEEFFHTFDVLHQRGKQIVIASDRSPRELLEMNERMRSRFECGLIADIGAPDPDVRRRIIEQKAQASNFTLPDEVIIYMADLIQSNIRALEGALIKLMAYVSVSKSSVTKELAFDVLSSYFKEGPINRIFADAPALIGTDRPRALPAPAIPVRGRGGPASSGREGITVDRVIDSVADYLGVDPRDVREGGARDRDTAFARQAAMYLARELTGAPTTALATAFNCKNHSAISHAHAKLRDTMASDAHVMKTLADLRQALVSAP